MSEEPVPQRRGLPPVDPVRLERSMRGIYSALLILQALVVLFVPRTIAQFGVGLTGVRLVVIIVVVVGLVALCAFITRSWAYNAAWVLHAATIALGFWLSAMFFLGTVFALLWYYAGQLHRDLRRRAEATPPPADV